MSTINNNLNTKMGLGAANARVLVVGLGKTGYSIASFLAKHNIQFAIADSREKPPFYQQMLTEMPDTPLFLGGFVDQAFAVATHLLISPGVSLAEPVIVKAISCGAKVFGDIDLFACSATAPIVAITGSNGKSTVTAMLGEMAEKAGMNVAVGGNLGTPALDLLDVSVELYVIELSSFQLERTSLLEADVATVLNLSPDHMDRHLTMESYAFEKSKVFHGAGTMVINADDVRVNAMRDLSRKVLSFSLQQVADFHVIAGEPSFLAHADQPLLAISKMRVQGQHNIANALTALALGFAIELAESAMLEALQDFRGLAHRMQKVAKINGVTWINDSKATNTGACIAALLGVSRKVILIAGGDCKKADMHDLSQIIKEKVKVVVLMGKDANLIKQALAGAVPAYIVETISEAVKKAAQLADVGETVLLSPACASLDQFKNYQERGNQFVLAVQGLQS